MFARKEDLRFFKRLFLSPNRANSTVDNQRSLRDIGVLFISETNKSVDNDRPELLRGPLCQFMDPFALFDKLCNQSLEIFDSMSRVVQQEEMFSVGPDSSSSPAGFQRDIGDNQKNFFKRRSIRVRLKMSLSVP